MRLWPFTARENPSTSPAEPRSAGGPGADSPPTIETRIEALEWRVDQVRLEWGEVIEQIRRWTGREAARRQKELKADLADQQQSTAPAADHASLEDEKMALRRRILRRG